MSIKPNVSLIVTIMGAMALFFVAVKWGNDNSIPGFKYIADALDQ